MKKNKQLESGIKLKNCYQAEDLPADLKTSLGKPGEYPFTRGIHADMYNGRLWSMRQYAGFGTAVETNKRYRMLLAQGTTGLSVAFDLPTQMGRDSDHELSKGEVGRVGVAISSVADMEDLFAEIPLEKVSVSMTINATAAILLAFILVVAEKRGITGDKLRGTIQNDLLKEYLARGTYVFPPKPALRITTDIFEFCGKNVPQWNTISVSGYHIREAGSTAVQEIAFTLGNGIEYIEQAIKRGLSVDDIAPRIAFFFNCQMNLFEEVAKFRAARRMWAKIMKERFKAQAEKSLLLRFHTQTAGSSLTAQQPYNNVVRTTIEALAAVLGGTQSLHTNGFDEAICLPSEFSASLALRTQQVIAHESGVADVVDPLAGSFYLEALTAQMEAEANVLLQKIEELGGMLSAVESGYAAEQIERSAYEFQRKVDSGETLVVGVNFATANGTEELEVPVFKPEGEAQQIKKLEKFKASRNSAEVNKALAEITSVAQGNFNLMPSIIEAARRGATLGEITLALEKVFSRYKPGK